MTTRRPPATLPEPGLRRSYWLRDALAADDDAAPTPPLEGVAEHDVVIVGGGYTGLWTAYHLIERDRAARVVILEQDICGGGPSGRNGGFLHGWWDQLPALVDLFGADAALEVARAADESVDTVEEMCRRHGIDAWFVRGGYLRVSASTAQDGDWRDAVEIGQALGVGDEFIELSPGEVQSRCASATFRGGALMRNGATLQPARLARGLRRVLLERGVTIHERTRATRMERRGRNGVRVTTANGEVRAEQAVLALNAWAAGWPWFRSSLVTWGSYILLTEPVPELLDALGWTGGEAITDSRFTVHYFRTTHDGRVAFGAGVGPAGYGGRIGAAFERDRVAVARAAAGLDRLLPPLAGVPIAEAWGGPIDVSSDRLPLIGSRAGGRIHYAHGYSGNGVGPAHLAGRIIAARITGADDPIARLALVERHARPFPPEPIRYLGARIVREALIRQDEEQDAERRPGWIVRFLGRLPRRLGYRLGPVTTRGH